MKLQIESCSNGWEISYKEETEDGKFVTVKELVIEKENHEGMKELLSAVANHFGEEYDKYGDNNLNIAWNLKGHKISDE
ncbi:MAG: hypothetical protein Q7S66_01650 [bacterium]|nr:hypothetical protein [bacterium]